MHRSSLAIVEVNNTGNSDSSYTVSLDDCTHPVVSMPVVTLDLEVSEVQDVSFEVSLLSMSLLDNIYANELCWKLYVTTTNKVWMNCECLQSY